MVSKIMDLPELLEVVYEQGRKSISLDAFVGLYHAESEEVSFPIMYDMACASRRKVLSAEIVFYAVS